MLYVSSIFNALTLQLHCIHFENNLFFVLIHIHFALFLYWSVYSSLGLLSALPGYCVIWYEARFDWLLCINCLPRVAFLRCRDRDLAVQGCQYNTTRCSGYQVLRLWFVVFSVVFCNIISTLMHCLISRAVRWMRHTVVPPLHWSTVPTSR
jgi:hypothetical protein